MPSIITNIIEPVCVYDEGIVVPPIFNGRFENQVAASSLIDSITVTSGTANIYGNIYSGYGKGMGSYHGSKSPSTIDLADGVEHIVEALRQHNNKVEFSLGGNSSQYLATHNPAGDVTNSDADSFKTIKFYNTSGNNLVLSFERADIPFDSVSRTGFINGSTISLRFPRWKQTSAEAGNYFINQTIRVELWS